ncbi:MAG: NADPH-dependent FMN reductase [Adhaeribacter sp.]
MPHLAIISASVRSGRNSHRAALFFQRYVQDQGLATAEILDLAAYRFPLFEERLSYLPAPSPQVLDFAGRIRQADGVIIVTPEYNGGYPASLKNVLDLLYEEWHRKPIAIATASDGAFGGTQVITSLLFTLWKIRAWVVPARLPLPKVQEIFDEQGLAHDPASTEKKAKNFIGELLWCIKAKSGMTKS